MRALPLLVVALCALLRLGALATINDEPLHPSAPSSSASLTPPNLLFFVVDDLRPELGGPYGVPGMITPGIDELMSRGVTFTRAYTNVPLCSPSRTSFLTGMRPRRTRVWSIGPYFRHQALNASAIVTLPQALKLAGYNTTGAGKIFHPGTSSGGALSPSVGGDDMPQSWSYPNGTPFHGYWQCDEFYNGTVQSPASVGWPGGTGCVQSAACVACFAAAGVNGSFDASWVAPPCPDTCFPDGLVAERAIAELEWKAHQAAAAAAAAGAMQKASTRGQDEAQSSVKKNGKSMGEDLHNGESNDGRSSDSASRSPAPADPGARAPPPFALFVGMKRPHLNQFAPAWAYASYDRAAVPLAAHRRPAERMPQIAFYENGEISGRSDIRPLMYTYTDAYSQRFSLVNDSKHQELRWAYRAAVTFMDRQVRSVVAALDRLGLANNTWIVLFGDHGWSLGEHGEWTKTANFETATRVPLVFVPPAGRSGDAYRRNATFPGLVELLDVFPTLAEVLGLPRGIVPQSQLDGKSFATAALRAARRGAGAVRDGRIMREQEEEEEAVMVEKEREVHGARASWSWSARRRSAVAAAVAGMDRGRLGLHGDFSAAFSEIARGKNAAPTTAPADGEIQGLSVRTTAWRFSAWVPFLYSKSMPDWCMWNQSLVELYDHRGDTQQGFEDYDASENVNLAYDAPYADVVAQLTAVLQAAWPGVHCV